jgi:hypothetical protein
MSEGGVHLSEGGVHLCLREESPMFEGGVTYV